MEDENNNESGLSDEELAAQQADEAAANAGDDAGADDGQPSGDDLNGGDDGQGEPTPDPEPDPPPEKAPLPKGVQKRIDKITRQKYDAERQIQALEQQLANRPEAQPANTEKPKPDDFEDDFEGTQYIEALTNWKVEQKFIAQQTQTVEQNQRTQQNQVLQEFETKRQAMVIDGITAYEDFEEVVTENPNLQITPQMADIITDSDIGRDIAHYLGSNTDEASRICQLPPLKQVAAIVRLETKLAAKPEKKVSKATAPIKPVGAKGSTTTKIDPKKDLRKWMEARNKEEFG